MSSFILIDGNPHDADYNYKTGDNTVGITYAEEQAGFLAGYAAVKEGNTKLASWAAWRFRRLCALAYGFVQGATMRQKS
jgi:basic membrane protein A